MKVLLVLIPPVLYLNRLTMHLVI